MSVKTVMWCALSAAFLATMIGAATAANPAAPAPPPIGGRGARGPTVPSTLDGTMANMLRMVTAIKADSSDTSKNEQTLRNLAIFQRDVAISKTLNPPIDRLAEADRPEGMAKFRAALNGLLKVSMELEDAINAKKPEEIKKLIAQLEEMERKGHEMFKVGG